jgi:hypothetical protein
MHAPHRSPFLPALILLGFSTLWTTALTLRPREGEAMAAIFPPGATRGQSLAAASGAGADEIVAFGNWETVVLVRSDQPDLASRLRSAGAWLVVRAPLAAGCLTLR